jgi:phosphoribosylaminoimidazole carboxylase PurE protein
MAKNKVLVGIIMGSDSDLTNMMETAKVLKTFGVPYFMTVASAHRTPSRVEDLARRAEKEDWKLIIAGAGMAAHLAGFIAAQTIIPVIGVPMDSSSLKGIDALLSTVQMPPGIPVACMGLGSSGAKNAGIFAVHVLAAYDKSLRSKLLDYRAEQRQKVDEGVARVEAAVI